MKPQKGRQVEDMIIQAAGSGRLGGRVDEPQLIGLLEQIAEHEAKHETKVTILRRHDASLDQDDDDEE